jgi:transmembrane sensor
MSKSRLAFLFQAYIDKTATPAEREELMELLQQTENNEQLRNLLTSTWQQYTSNNQPFSDSEGDDMLAAILQQGRLSKPTAVMAPQPAKRPWRMLAAAVLLFMVCGLWFVVGRRNAEQPAAMQAPGAKESIMPGTDKAVLTLANGNRIVLDSTKKGMLTRQGDVHVMNIQAAELSYDAGHTNMAATMFNTLSTPRGGQYKLQLADGTKVWLNASSSITFPVAFTDNERRVTITGEAYFEVASLPAMPGEGSVKGKKPFIVNINGKADVLVLGTHFNINAYDDEESIRTTLLEGKVKVSRTDSRLSAIDSRLLSPGYQAKIKASGEIKTGIADIEEVMAWKNGWFQFNGGDIKTIMRQVSRWYDVDIMYEGKIPTGHYSGIVSRENNIGQVLRIMQAGGVGFKIAGRKVTVFEEHH